MEEDEDLVTAALNFLESQGFYVRNLWHVQDVHEKFVCSDEEALDILEEAVSGEWVIENINDRIAMFGANKDLEEK